MIDEFSFAADEFTAMVTALQVKHSCCEHLRECYIQL